MILKDGKSMDKIRDVEGAKQLKKGTDMHLLPL
jgi:hypothetical protein